MLPVVLATATDVTSVARTLMDELRRRGLIVPGPFVIEQLVAAATALAERHVAHRLTCALLSAQRDALDASLAIKDGTSMSGLPWSRQPPCAPGHRPCASC